MLNLVFGVQRLAGEGPWELARLGRRASGVVMLCVIYIYNSPLSRRENGVKKKKERRGDGGRI